MIIHNIKIHVQEELVFIEIKRHKYVIVSEKQHNNRYVYRIPIVGDLITKTAIKIWSINRLLNYDVIIEPRKPSSVTPPQCKNSQKD